MTVYMIRTYGKRGDLELYQRMFEGWMTGMYDLVDPEIVSMMAIGGDKQMSNHILIITIALRYLYIPPYQNLHINPINILTPITTPFKTTILTLGQPNLTDEKMLKGLVVVVLILRNRYKLHCYMKYKLYIMDFEL